MCDHTFMLNQTVGFVGGTDVTDAIVVAVGVNLFGTATTQTDERQQFNGAVCIHSFFSASYFSTILTHWLPSYPPHANNVSPSTERPIESRPTLSDAI